MERIERLCCLVVMAAFLSCSRGSGHYVQDPGKSSGFGYASGLYHDGAEVSFDVFSGTGGPATVIVRCRCRFGYDADACVISSGGNTCPLQIPLAGQWCEVSTDIMLEKGMNRIYLRTIHPLKDDIHIDYIEILR